MTTHYFAEKNSPSDEELYIHEIYVSSGDKVKSGEVLMAAEGAKALFDIEMPEDGYVTLHVSVGTQVPIGTKLFSISQTNSAPLDEIDSPKSEGVPEQNVGNSTSHFSKVALELATRYKMDLSLFKDLEFVTSEDVKSRSTFRAERVVPGRLFNDFKALALIGGGMAAEVLLERLRASSQLSKVVGYFDKSEKVELGDIKYFGEPVKDSIFKGFANGEFDGLLITVTSNMKFRRELLDLIEELEIPLATFIDEQSFVSESALIGAGSVILDSARVGHKAQIGKNVFLSGFVNIDHHCIVGENSTFGPGVFFSGNVTAGVDIVFGSNIAVEPGITIGDNCKVASGTILTKNVPPATVVKAKSTTTFRE
jgi:acetyltransferase-like isoleucine patch superfamily enzyme